MAVTHYIARLYSVNGVKARKDIEQRARATDYTREGALNACLERLPKSYKGREVKIIVTPCEKIDRGTHSMELALVARAEFVTVNV